MVVQGPATLRRRASRALTVLNLLGLVLACSLCAMVGTRISQRLGLWLGATWLSVHLGLLWAIAGLRAQVEPYFGRSIGRAIVIASLLTGTLSFWSMVSGVVWLGAAEKRRFWARRGEDWERLEMRRWQALPGWKRDAGPAAANATPHRTQAHPRGGLPRQPLPRQPLPRQPGAH